MKKIVRAPYSKLLRLYPRQFRERLGESMEQTFQDLWNEKRQAKRGVFGFILWTFLETAIGILREHLLLISPGDLMQTMLRTIGSSALVGLMFILPFTVMEVVNRRNFNEGFPFMLFFLMWLNLFAITLILLPIVRTIWIGKRDMAISVPVQENTLLTNSRSTAIISIVVLLSPGILPLLDFLGWVSVDRLFNGPNPEVAFLPGLVLFLSLLLFPIVAGVIAARPVASTLRAGGSLFAHPLHLIIVVFILSAFAISLAGSIIDQWSCFMGVPNCD